MTTELRRTTIFRAMHRPNLILGAEREPALMLAIVAGGIAITAMNLPATLVSALMWFGLITPLRMAARADPRMSRVYLRYIRYAHYYPAHSRPD